MIAFKSGVRLVHLSDALIHIIKNIIMCHEVQKRIHSNLPRTLTITSINDSRHVVNSKHYMNAALDLRSKNFPSVRAKRRFRRSLAVELNSSLALPRFTVILKRLNKPSEHFHIQVKKGEVF